jgi:hypothetical protein
VGGLPIENSLIDRNEIWHNRLRPRDVQQDKNHGDHSRSFSSPNGEVAASVFFCLLYYRSLVERVGRFA